MNTSLCFPSVHLEFISSGHLAVPPFFGPSTSELLHTTSLGSFPLLYPSEFWQLKIGLVSKLDLVKLNTSQSIILIQYTKFTMTLTVRTKRGKEGEHYNSILLHRGFALSTFYISFFNNYFYFTEYLSANQSSEDYLQQLKFSIPKG